MVPKPLLLTLGKLLQLPIKNRLLQPQLLVHLSLLLVLLPLLLRMMSLYIMLPSLLLP